jgi:cell division protein ZapA
MSETTLVDLMILNRSFKVKVDTQQVALVQQRMEAIQAKLLSLKSNFPGRDVQDYLSMSLIDAVSESLQTEDNQLKNETLFAELKKLNELLD